MTVPDSISSRYPLTGIRQATTEPQQALLAHATEILSADPRLVAAYLVGSFAVGQGDPFSDLDLQCLAAADAVDDLRDTWMDLAGRISPTVAIEPFRFSVGGSCLTPEWLHFDLVFHPPGTLDPGTVEGMMPLFDKTGVLPDHPLPRPSGRGEPFLPLPAVNWVLYMTGNMVSPIARGEPIPLTNAAVLFRDLGLIPLFLAEQGMTHVPPGRKANPLNPFPYTKRLRPYLTDEQNEILAALPAAEPNVDSAVDAILAVLRVFLPRARRLAATTGTPWPVEYEAASVGYLERSLGAPLGLVPDDPAA